MDHGLYHTIDDSLRRDFCELVTACILGRRQIRRAAVKPLSSRSANGEFVNWFPPKYLWTLTWALTYVKAGFNIFGAKVTIRLSNKRLYKARNVVA
eukprot:1176829-Prorocentrum_minimum.AAC.6